MELVTLANVTLKRIGSASSVYMANQREVSVIKEVADGSTQTLRDLVLEIAEENGEPRENLRAMVQANSWDYVQQRDAVVFNIQGRSTQYSTPYAVCYAHPALKIGNRYFKLDEITL